MGCASHPIGLSSRTVHGIARMSSENWHFTITALAVFVAAVAILDLNTHRIPNRLTVPAAALAVCINYLASGALGALHSIEGLAVGFVAFLPMFLAGGTGAGDVKAMAAVGAFLGPVGAFFAVLWTLVCGLIGGLLVLVGAAGPAGVRELLRRWVFRTYVLCTSGHAAHVSRTEDEAAKQRFPYGIAIATGTIVSLIWGAYRG